MNINVVGNDTSVILTYNVKNNNVVSALTTKSRTTIKGFKNED